MAHPDDLIAHACAHDLYRERDCVHLVQFERQNLQGC
jgi:hypothetical protein